MGPSLRSRLAVVGWLAWATLAGLTGCGGGGGGGEEAAPPTAPPVAVRAPVIDSARASSVSIGPAGGTVQAAGADGVQYTLTVPPHALTTPVTIRMTPIVDIANPALAAGLSGAVQFEPSGLRFKRLATLRIGALPVLSGGKRLLGFSSASDGTAVRINLPTVRNGGIEVLVEHFSNAGAAAATPAQAALMPSAPNLDRGSPGFWFEQMLASDRSPSALALAFIGWFDAIVSPALQAASATDASALDAVASYELWRTSVDESGAVWGLSDAQTTTLRDLLAALDTRAKTALARILRDTVDADLAACRANANIGRLDFASLLQQLAARFGLDTPEQGLDRVTFLRKVNDCVRPVLDPATVPDSLSVGQPVSLDQRAQLVINGQPNPVGGPFQFTITPSGATVATPVGFSDGAGRFTTVYTPSAATPTFNVRACLVLTDANGTAGSDICVSQRVASAQVVLAGSITSSVDLPSGSQLSAERNVQRTIGTVRIGVDAAGVVRVLQSSASYEESGVAIVSGCFDPALNRVREREMRYTSASVGEWTAFFTAGSTLTDSAIGAANNPDRGMGIAFSGLKAGSVEEFVDGNTSCAVKLTSTPPRAAVGGSRVRSIERDASGRISAVDFTETFTRQQGSDIFVSIGRLVAE